MHTPGAGRGAVEALVPGRDHRARRPAGRVLPPRPRAVLLRRPADPGAGARDRGCSTPSTRSQRGLAGTIGPSCRRCCTCRTASPPGPPCASATRGRTCRVVRTVHHVDDFTTPALIECQRRSILEPDRRARGQPARGSSGSPTTTASRPTSCTNGVDLARFGRRPPAEPSRRAAGAGRCRRPLPHPDRRWHRAPQGHRPPVSGAVAPAPDVRRAARAGHRRRSLLPGPHAVPRPRPRLDGRTRPRARSRRRARSARSPTTRCRRGTTPPTPSRSPPSTRGSGSPCWRRWRPACRWSLTDLPVFAEYLRFGEDAAGGRPRRRRRTRRGAGDGRPRRDAAREPSPPRARGRGALRLGHDGPAAHRHLR